MVPDDFEPAKQPLLPRAPSWNLANGSLLDRAGCHVGDEATGGSEQHCERPNKKKSCCSAVLRLAASTLLVLAAAAAAQLTAVPALCSNYGWACTCAGQPSPLPPSDAHWPQFLVLGDWGRKGKHNQTAVAAAMDRKAEAMRIDFVVSTGDNFYKHGLASPADPAFYKSFTRVYHHASLQVPFHAVLGNHDYGEAEAPAAPTCGTWDPDCYYSPLHQLDARLAARDPRWHCERSFQLSLAGGRVDLFFIDTTPLMLEYAKVPWRSNRGGLDEQSWEAQMLELEGRLSRSRARWKLVVGHHPIRTNHRKFGHIYPEMEERLEPLLIQYGVAAYLHGHDHNLAALHDPSVGYYQIISGAGSKIGPKFRGHKDALFQYGANGFVAVKVREEAMTVEFIGLDSDQPLFSLEVPPR